MARKTRQRKKKRFIQGKAYFATFNNTIITLTDESGNVLYSSGAGSVGFKGSRKSHLAAQSAESLAKKAEEVGLNKLALLSKDLVLVEKQLLSSSIIWLKCVKY